MDRKKVIKELHDARRYLEDKEWSDRGASPHIDAINNAIAMLKEQEVATVLWIHRNGFGSRVGACPNCKSILLYEYSQSFCGRCGQAVKWDE